MPKCLSCGAEIYWQRTKSGKAAPISKATGESHFIDCRQNRLWQGKHRGDPDAPVQPDLFAPPEQS